MQYKEELPTHSKRNVTSPPGPKLAKIADCCLFVHRRANSSPFGEFRRFHFILADFSESHRSVIKSIEGGGGVVVSGHGGKKSCRRSVIMKLLRQLRSFLGVSSMAVLLHTVDF